MSELIELIGFLDDTNVKVLGCVYGKRMHVLGNNWLLFAKVQQT